jgi:hypothetical protein
VTPVKATDSRHGASGWMSSRYVTTGILWASPSFRMLLHRMCLEVPAEILEGVTEVKTGGAANKVRRVAVEHRPVQVSVCC